MTVRVGTSVVAGSGADAQEVNALIESVNSLVEEVKELKEKLQSGSGGSGSGGALSENVTLTLRFPCISSTWDSGLTYVTHTNARLLVNGVDYYSQLVGKMYSLYPHKDNVVQVQVPRNESVLIQATLVYRYYDNYNRKNVDTLITHKSRAFTAEDHCFVDFEVTD